ncbi:hypothetical protein DICPUDRAFT_147478 [Dictyostelium purpureum]|uniref:Uncharacterized protein n=1 Tax=Dictyostelium purpureum TaxID=5786 RepID=F0Z8K9_DICPU|nr:uncharacterized protein DICPUDRAFT_147478 [Dictyostelium purpureum]EGC39746.1 hypothetical protein DICPUDRAFT_147478 [Dictyostelium purpureum]|eukprot:XP_003283732.1 hypothetical protein DICPUDRAFT_147478 [Dictyostelium purpureum]
MLIFIFSNIVNSQSSQEQTIYNQDIKREFKPFGENGTIFTILQDNGQDDPNKKVLAIGTKQKPTSRISFNSEGLFDYFAPPEKDNVNPSFDVLNAAVYEGCLVIFYKIQGKPMISLYNTRKKNSDPITYQLSHNIDALSVDDTFVWAAYKTKNSTTIRPYVHSSSIGGKCSKFQMKDSSSGVVSYNVPVASPQTVISQHLTTSLKGVRHIYIFDKDNHVLLKYDYDPSLGTFTPVPGIINIGSACDVKFFYFDPKKDISYFMASYDDGYNIYAEKSEKSIKISNKKDTNNYCGPFASIDLDTYYSKPGDTSLYRYTPAFGINVTTPCFNQTNGKIEILLPNPNDYKVKWNDGSTALVRDKLKEGNYTFSFSLKDIDREINRKIFSLKAPDNPMLYAINQSCVGTANGIINFNSTKHDDLSYSYFYMCPNCTGSKVNKTTTSSTGKFSHLFGDFTYIFWLETVDSHGHKCVYDKTEITLENVVIDEPKIEYTNNTCYNSSDAQISILNYNPKKYLYKFASTQNITNTGIIYQIPTRDGSGFNIDIIDRISRCSSHVNVPIKSPPEPKYPVIFPVRPKCHGGTGTLDIKEIPGMKYIVTGPGGKTIMPLFVNKTFKYKNLHAGKYHVDFSIENDKSKVLCSAGRINFTLTEPKPVKLLETYIQAEDCSARSLADMIVYARGGTPLNGTTYFFDNKYSKNDGPFLNVSFWVDGIYKLNVSDANHCTVQYNNVTIKRPSKCQVHNINGIPHLGVNNQNNAHHSDTKKSKLGLILGLCLGIGIPFLIIGTALAVILIKKYAHFSSTPTPRNQPRPNTVPVFMGGKIHNIDNF